MVVYKMTTPTTYIGKANPLEKLLKKKQKVYAAGILYIPLYHQCNDAHNSQNDDDHQKNP